MSCTEEIHVGDIGTVFKVTISDDGVAVNISSATTKQLVFKKPDGSNLTAAASFFTDGSDGILTYTTISGDLDQPGSWKLQVYLVLTSGEWRSNTASFKVYSNL